MKDLSIFSILMLFPLSYVHTLSSVLFPTSSVCVRRTERGTRLQKYVVCIEVNVHFQNHPDR
jgi:hypothetical protein